jgi:hypothetical protein
MAIVWIGISMGWRTKNSRPVLAKEGRAEVVQRSNELEMKCVRRHDNAFRDHLLGRPTLSIHEKLSYLATGSDAVLKRSKQFVKRPKFAYSKGPLQVT